VLPRFNQAGLQQQVDLARAARRSMERRARWIPVEGPVRRKFLNYAKVEAASPQATSARRRPNFWHDHPENDGTMTESRPDAKTGF